MNEDKRQWVEKGLQLAMDLGNVYTQSVGYAWAEAVAALTKHLETVPEVTVNVPEFVGAGIYSYSETVGSITAAASAETLWELKDIWKTMNRQADGSGGEPDLSALMATLPEAIAANMALKEKSADIDPDFFREALDTQDRLIDHLREALEAKTTDGQNALRAELAAANTELEDLRDDARRFTEALAVANEKIENQKAELARLTALLGVGTPEAIPTAIATLKAMADNHGTCANALRIELAEAKQALEISRASIPPDVLKLERQITNFMAKAISQSNQIIDLQFKLKDLQFKLNDANDSIDELRENHTTLIEVRRLLGLGSGADVEARVSALVTKRGRHAAESAELRAKVENQSAALKELNRTILAKNSELACLRVHAASARIDDENLLRRMSEDLAVSSSDQVPGAIGDLRNFANTQFNAANDLRKDLDGANEVIKELRSDLLRNSTLRAELRDVLGISTDADILGAVANAVSQPHLLAMWDPLATLRRIEPISTVDASGPILVFQFWNGEDLRKASKEWDTFCKFMGPVR